MAQKHIVRTFLLCRSSFEEMQANEQIFMETVFLPNRTFHCSLFLLCLCSVSEPSLLNPKETVLFCGNHCPRQGVFQKHPSVPPISRLSLPLACELCPPPRVSQLHKQQSHREVRSCNRPGFINFCQAIRPSSKPRPTSRHLHNASLTTETRKPRSAVIWYPNSPFLGEPLSITGKPCLLSSCQRSVVSTVPVPARPQLHIFLPTDDKGVEMDSESVDEGFLDELDDKITSLKLQQGSAQTVK